MTEANQKKLYEHFTATGQTERAEEILKVYPNFSKVVEEVKPKKEK